MCYLLMQDNLECCHPLAAAVPKLPEPSRSSDEGENSNALNFPSIFPKYCVVQEPFHFIELRDFPGTQDARNVGLFSQAVVV